MMSKKNLNYAIYSNKFIIGCNIVIIILILLISNQIYSKKKLIFVELNASKEVNYQITNITGGNFDNQNKKMFLELQEIFQDKNYKLNLMSDEFKSSSDKFKISFTYELTPKNFIQEKYEIDEKIIYSKLNNFFDKLIVQYKKTLLDDLRTLQNWEQFYRNSLNSELDLSISRMMSSDLIRTNYQILKVKHLLSQMKGVKKVLEDPKNYTLTLKTTNISISYVDILELIFVYLIIFNTIILITRRYRQIKI